MPLITHVPVNSKVQATKLSVSTPPIALAVGLMHTGHSMHYGAGFHLESLNTLSTDWANSLNQRINILALAVNESFLKVGSYFNFNSGDRYAIRNLSYADVSLLPIPNPMGLQGTMVQLVTVLNDSFIVAKHIFETELPTQTRLVAALLGDPEILNSKAPHPFAIDLQTTSSDINSLRDRINKIMDSSTEGKVSPFGSLYHSLNQWADVSTDGYNLARSSGKLDVKGIARNVAALTTMLDKLIILVKKNKYPSDNVELYSKLIEEASGNIAFAGGVIQLIASLEVVLNEHRNLVAEESKKQALLKKK